MNREIESLIAMLGTLQTRINVYENNIRLHADKESYVSSLRDRIQEITVALKVTSGELSDRFLLLPLTGVVCIHKIDWDEVDVVTSHHPVLEERIAQHVSECENEQCIESDHEWYKVKVDTEDDYPTLIGDWAKNEKGEWDSFIGGPHGFSAVLRESVIQVVGSNFITSVRSMCSPCYPNQADLDSGEQEDGILAYTLPPSCFREEGQ